MHASMPHPIRRGLGAALLILAATVGLGACTSDTAGRIVVVTTAGGSGNLVVLDPTNGDVLGEVETFGICDGMVECDLGSLRAMAYHEPSGFLIAGTNAENEFCQTCLIAIDLQTGEAEIISDNDDLQNAVGMDFSVDGIGGITLREDGIIFATLKQGEGGSPGLVTFGEVAPLTYLGMTGVAASVMMDFDLGNAIEFDALSTLHYTTGAGLSTIDPATAVATHVGAITLAGFTSGADPGDEDFVRVNSLTILPNGDVLGIFVDDGPRYLGALDLSTRVFSTVDYYGADDFNTATGLGRVDGLAWIPDTQIRGRMQEIEPPM